jgi:hypothetical protein
MLNIYAVDDFKVEIRNGIDAFFEKSFPLVAGKQQSHVPTR